MLILLKQSVNNSIIMNRKEENKHLNKEWKQINFHLNAFLETGNQEELHRFRVQIKKLKAMLTMFQHGNKRQVLLKNFKPIAKIFKLAGNIRDAHTNMLLKEKYNIKNDLFEEGQQKIIENGISQFKEKGSKYLKRIKEVQADIKKNLSNIEDKAIADFYKIKLEIIAKKLAVPNFNEDMHYNRKIIKTLVYNHKLANKALNGIVTINSEYLDKLQDVIGEWHDNIIAAQLFATTELNDKTIVTKIKRKNTSVKKNILDLATNFLQKATLAEADVLEKQVEPV